jgi:hypothetical protein
MHYQPRHSTALSQYYSTAHILTIDLGKAFPGRWFVGLAAYLAYARPPWLLSEQHVAQQLSHAAAIQVTELVLCYR